VPDRKERVAILRILLVDKPLSHRNVCVSSDQVPNKNTDSSAIDSARLQFMYVVINITRVNINL